MKALRPLLGFVFGLSLCLVLTGFAGENPFHILAVLTKSAFGTKYDLGLTLFYTTSLIFTGLSVCLAFHAGLFNIGAEGQLNIGAMAALAVGLIFPNCPPFFAPFLAAFSAFFFAGLWGLIPGWLRAYRGSHEVVVTMMMNFLAAGITGYMTLNLFKSAESQNPETQSLPAQYLFKGFDFVSDYFTESPVNLSLLIAIGTALLVWILLEKSSFGFQIKMTGKNELAAGLSGISAKKIRMLAMALAGAMAGLVALNDVLGSSGKYTIGFSADYGFVGIAVALLARNNPLAIILSAFLFGGLQKGAADLDLETQFITRDFAKILQAIIIFSVVGFQYFKLPKSFRKLNFIPRSKT